MFIYLKYIPIAMDMLQEVFNTQDKFQNSMKVTYDMDYLKVMILACVDELTEILRETPWKPWKKQQNFNKENYKEELVDLFHFFINLCLFAGMDAQELFARYNKKMVTNQKRQQENY